MADKSNNFMSFFRSDYFTWKNSVVGSVCSQIMYVFIQKE